MATNLGTAYVSVMPSMRGFGAAVESGMSGIDTTAAGSAMGARAASGFAGGMAKNGLVIGAASALAGRAFDAVASSADRAIARVDTMQNFPKVMQNLGYGAEEAAKSINTMSDRLDGLPTALDSMVSMTQQLAPLTGDLSSATEVALAFNDMMLAGGASTMEQASALTQYTQALAKGKPEMNDWRTLQQAMPGQLNQVAQAMLGAGKNSTDLYEALKDGTVTMLDFNQAVLKLDKEGINGFASFEQQARDATTGIQTAIDNMNTRIAKGVATLIDSVGQENISGAINTLSSGIGDVAKDLGEGLKVATGFVKEYEDELKGIVHTAYEVAPAVIGAWAAFKVLRGGGALLSGISTALGGGIAKLGQMGAAAQGLGFSMKSAGIIGAQSMYNLGGILSDVSLVFGSMTLGASALTGGLAVGIAALMAYNQHLWNLAAAEAGLTAEQQALVDNIHQMSTSYQDVITARDGQIDGINSEFAGIQSLRDEYNGLIDANGTVIEGNEERAAQIIGSLAAAMGVEEGEVRNLIDEYGHLGDAAGYALEKRRAEKILEADNQAYAEAATHIGEYAKAYADAQAMSAEKTAESAKANDAYQSSWVDMVNTMAPEAISYGAMAMGDLAYSATSASEAAVTAANSVDEAGKTVDDALTTIENHEGLEAALSSGDADAVQEWSTRVTESIVSAENGTRASLEAQVAKFQESYDSIAAAVANGDTSLEGSLSSMGAALDIAKGELDRYNSVVLTEKFASITVDDGQLKDAQGNVYVWNGQDLVNQSTNVSVDWAELVDAQGDVHIWNGTDLDDRDAYVSVDYSSIGAAESAWAGISLPTQTAYIDVVRREQDAAGGFFALHASGGFITNGQTYLGRDKNGVGHIAGEAGREWIMKHADGTTSILPIENKKYLEPYASTIAKMVGGGGRTVNVSVNLNYQAGDDAAKLARDVTNRIEAYLAMGA